MSRTVLMWRLQTGAAAIIQNYESIYLKWCTRFYPIWRCPVVPSLEKCWPTLQWWKESKEIFSKPNTCTFCFFLTFSTFKSFWLATCCPNWMNNLICDKFHLFKKLIWVFLYTSAQSSTHSIYSSILNCFQFRFANAVFEIILE